MSSLHRAMKAMHLSRFDSAAAIRVLKGLEICSWEDGVHVGYLTTVRGAVPGQCVVAGRNRQPGLAMPQLAPYTSASCLHPPLHPQRCHFTSLWSVSAPMRRPPMLGGIGGVDRHGVSWSGQGQTAWRWSSSGMGSIQVRMRSYTGWTSQELRTGRGIAFFQGGRHAQ